MIFHLPLNRGYVTNNFNTQYRHYERNNDSTQARTVYAQQKLIALRNGTTCTFVHCINFKKLLTISLQIGHFSSLTLHSEE